MKSSSGVAPLKVSNTTKVSKLNSDLLDGLDSKALARTKGQTGEIDATGQAVDIDGDGTPDVIGAEADCPAGSIVTGGGSANLTTTGITIVDGPAPGGWIAFSTYDPTQDDPTHFTVSAVCYNPLGSVSGAQSLKGAHVSLQKAARAELNHR